MLSQKIGDVVKHTLSTQVKKIASSWQNVSRYKTHLAAE